MRAMVLGLMLLPAAAQAQESATIAAPEFIARWNAIQDPGGDRTAKATEAMRLAAELGGSFDRYKRALEWDAAASRPPRACPVKGSEQKFDMKQMVVAFEALPEAQRSGSLDTMLFAYLDRRYPCPAPAAVAP